ncbi:hypothetical protein FQA39_LY15456 [Lamprigera yunnana]|nr:hypothetical protein FQA39_LY15456 [Lamprigera yunnana]
MWMLYVKQHWTKAIDLKSAVEHLYDKTSALEFDSDHEGIYRMERKFLKGKYCSQCLLNRMTEVELQNFWDTIKDYIKCFSNSDISFSDEEESKAVELNGEDSETAEEESKKKKLCEGGSITKTVS